MEDTLTDKQRKFVELYTSGKMDKVQSARAAGYQGSGAKKAGTRLLKNPIVRQAIESVQAEARTVAVYDLATAMKEAKAVCTFAKRHKNAMAYCKATELRAKLSRLLIDRVEIIPVDLVGALEKAERRVLDLTPLLSNDALAGPVHWALRIPGDSETGSADGKS
jgi:hypothetical protein